MMIDMGIKKLEKQIEDLSILKRAKEIMRELGLSEEPVTRQDVPKAKRKRKSGYCMRRHPVLGENIPGKRTDLGYALYVVATFNARGGAHPEDVAHICGWSSKKTISNLCVLSKGKYPVTRTDTGRYKYTGRISAYELGRLVGAPR